MASPSRRVADQRPARCRAGRAPQGSPNVRPVRGAGAFEEAAPIVAREVDEPLRAHQRGAQALDHREQRLGEQRLRIGEGRRRSSWPCACAWRSARATRGAPRTSSSQGTSAAVPSSPSGKLARSAAGLRRASSRCSATTASAGREIQLGQQDPVGRLDLRARLLVPGQLAAARLRVDDADDARRRRPAPRRPDPPAPTGSTTARRSRWSPAARRPGASAG